MSSKMEDFKPIQSSELRFRREAMALLAIASLLGGDGVHSTGAREYQDWQQPGKQVLWLWLSGRAGAQHKIPA